MPSYSRHDLADLSAFAAICRRGSFRLAATELGVSTSALSHALRNLEDRLGVKLLNRTTRSVAPTEAGSRLAAQLDQSFGEIGEALSELDRYRSAPLGGLRINVPRDASRLLLSPVLARYLEDCPGVKIEVVVDNNMVDIVKAGFDAGIRFGDTVPQDMVWTSAILTKADFALALGLFGLLVYARWSPLWVVLAAAAGGWALGWLA